MANFRRDVEVVKETKTSLNDLPVPKGSWQTKYSEQTGRWNMLLAGSAAFFSVTMYAVSNELNVYYV